MDERYAGRGKLDNYRKRSYPDHDSERRKRHNSSHDSSAEPIDTLYRILCPLSKIGSVLGKGGERVTAIRNETHAKIRVTDAAPGADERVIIIYSYERKMSDEPDSGRNLDGAGFRQNVIEYMKPLCPAQDALLKVHDRIVEDEVLSGKVVRKSSEPNSDVFARILVPENQVGCLLGKGGIIIQKLRKDTGASIRILIKDRLPPCAMKSDELVQISGVPSIVRKALFAVSTLLHQHPKKENLPLNDLISVSTGGLGSNIPSPLWRGTQTWLHQHPDAHMPPAISWFGGDKDEVSRYASDSYGRNDGRYNGEEAIEFTVRVLCPVGRVGGIIGKGGATVRHLEQQIGVSIKVQDNSPDDKECVVSVSSKEVPSSPVSPAIEALLELQLKTTLASQDGKVTTRLLVESSKVGCIIGQGGDVINNLRRQTRADIKIISKGDHLKYTSGDEVVVQLSGKQNIARDALAEIASRLRARILGVGDAAIEPVPPPPFYGSGLSGNLSIQYPSARENVGPDPPTRFHRHGSPDSFSGREMRPSPMFGKGYSSGYEYPKGAGEAYEAYHDLVPPSAMRYSEFSRPFDINARDSVPSAYEASGSRTDALSQISGARWKQYDPYSTSPEYPPFNAYGANQIKSSHSYLEGFNIHDRRRPPLPDSPSFY